MSVIGIVLADDHPLVRAGLRSLLQRFADFKIVGEATDGREALQLIRKLAPTIALIDISMPNLNGLETTARVSKEHLATRVLILSMHADEEYVREAFKSGASGYVLKNADENELELAVRAVARGDSWLSPGISRPVVAAFTRSAQRANEALDVLTPRQREVLHLIAQRYSTREVARRLDISIKTVENHRTQIMDRLGVKGVESLVRYAVRAGIVRP